MFDRTLRAMLSKVGYVRLLCQATMTKRVSSSSPLLQFRPLLPRPFKRDSEIVNGAHVGEYRMRVRSALWLCDVQMQDLRPATIYAASNNKTQLPTTIMTIIDIQGR